MFLKKKRLVLFLIVSLVSLTTACGKAETTDSADSESEGETGGSVITTTSEREPRYMERPSNEIEEMTERVSIIDASGGDTIEIENADKDWEAEIVKLLLIDVPEGVPGNTLDVREQASNELKALSDRNGTRLERGNPDKDDEGNTLGYIWVSQDGAFGDINFAEYLLRNGLAKVVDDPDPDAKYLEEFREAEQKAKDEKEGIWSDEAE